MKVARRVRRADRRNPPAERPEGRSGPTQRTVTRYKWIAARKAEGFPITMACKVAEASRQAFHDSRAKRAAGPTDAEIAAAVLVAEMREIQADFDDTYGQPGMTPELRERGFEVKNGRS